MLPDGSDRRIAAHGQNHPNSRGAGMNTTRHETLPWLLALILAAAPFTPARADNQDRGGDAKTSDNAADRKTTRKKHLSYKPPPGRGAPDIREGGGARAGSDYPDLYVVCPAHRAWTVSAHPVLHWFQSRAADIPLKITVYREEDGESIFVHHLKGPKTAGFNQIDLAEHDVALEEGRKYVWTVSYFNGESRDAFSETTFERIVLPPQLARALTDTDPSEHAWVYAENGIWYEALTALTREIAKHPGDKSLRTLRSELVLDELLVQVRAQEPLDEDKEEKAKTFLDTYGSHYD